MSIRKRMISPDLFSDPDLTPLDKRYLYENLPVLAEDSGCLRWDARMIAGDLFRFDNMPLPRIQELMAELVQEGRVWLYEAEGKMWAYLPEFRVWQRSLTRWNEPVTVPLPAGVAFEPSEHENQKGSGRYVWPEPSGALASLSPETDKGSSPTPSELKVLESKGPARSLPAARGVCPDCDGTGVRIRDGKPCDWTSECAAARELVHA
jgi:hypothetical protein